jgi:hypothetical protein
MPLVSSAALFITYLLQTHLQVVTQTGFLVPKIREKQFLIIISNLWQFFLHQRKILSNLDYKHKNVPSFPNSFNEKMTNFVGKKSLVRR